MNSHHQACQQAWIPWKPSILVLLVLQLTIVSAKKERPQKVGLFQGFHHLDLVGLKNITEITSENSKNRSTLVVFHSYTKTANGKMVNFLESLPHKLLKRSSQVQLCMFDCNMSPEECGRLGIEEYPTISLFFHRNKVEYQGKKVLKQLATWIDRRTSIFAQEVQSVHELNSHLDFVKAQLSLKYKQQALVSFCGSPAQEGFTTFNRLSREREYHESYVYSNSSAVWNRLNCSSGDIMFFGSRGWTRYQQNSRKTYSLERFVLKQKYYHVGFLNFFSYARFCQANSQMVVLVDVKMNEKHFRLLQEVASKMAKSANQIAFYFISSQTREGMSRRMVKRVDSLLGVNGEADKPTLRFVKVQGHHLEKFKFADELKVNSVVNWLQRVHAGQEKGYLRSQPIKQHHKAFKRLVSSNFDEFYQNPDSIKCVYYFENYAKCHYCKEAFISFRTTAVKFHQQVKNGTRPAGKITFATINAAKNDLPGGIVMEKLPTVTCYPNSPSEALVGGISTSSTISVEKIEGLIKKLEAKEAGVPIPEDLTILDGPNTPIDLETWRIPDPTLSANPEPTQEDL